ncbi:MAG: MATE family efflux transporter [Clostridiales bacterium]|nr:MATE family efflux transporter [Clostridiales bacterium]
METATYEKLRDEKVSKLLLQLGLPSIAAQLINVLYNIVDRMYIGHIEGVGANALTGLGVSLPIITLISAFSAFAGMGGAPLAAIELGRNDKKRAEKILGNATFMLVVFSIFLTIFFYIFKTPLLYLFGASEETIPYANEYLNIYLIGTIFVQFALGLNTFISCQGFAKTAMLSVLIGAILNIVLDPLFIFVFHMGVSGAALATIISQAVSALWVVLFLVGKTTGLKIRKINLRPERSIIFKICSLGISPFIMQSTESLVSIVLNSGMQYYGGDLYVGSLTIMQSVMQLISIPVQGFTNGIQPIISYNFGARLNDRVKKAFYGCLAMVTSTTIICCIVICLIPATFASLFTSSPELIAQVEKMMPIFICGISVFGIQMSCQPTFIGLGQAKLSLFLAILRKIILLIPLAIILPMFFGVNGIYFAEPIADIISALTAGTLFFLNFNRILKMGPKSA